MYKCEVTGKQVSAGIPQARIVTKTREKQYFAFDLKGKTRPVGTGYEIVEEVAACPFCAAPSAATAETGRCGEPDLIKAATKIDVSETAEA